MIVQPSPTRFPPREMVSVADLSAVRAEFVAWLEGAGETPPGASRATVAAHIDVDVLVVEVANEVSAAATTPSEHEWDLNDPLRTGGRGLLLVSAFVDDIDVDVVGRRLVVRCTAAL